MSGTNFEVWCFNFASSDRLEQVEANMHMYKQVSKDFIKIWQTPTDLNQNNENSMKKDLPIFFSKNHSKKDVWKRMKSHPIHDKAKVFVRSGIRTHAHIRGPECSLH